MLISNRTWSFFGGSRTTMRRPEKNSSLAYTPMVKCLVRNSYGKLLDHEDLTQEGLIGLLGAIDEYDGETHNIKFSSFAYCVSSGRSTTALGSPETARTGR